MKKKINKAIFLDRDGVINKEIGYLHKTKDFKFIKAPPFLLPPPPFFRSILASSIVSKLILRLGV